MRSLLLVICLTLGSALSAQILEENTQLLSAARGDAAFELNAGEHIYTYQGEDGWYKARKMVYLKAADIDENRLRAGAKLYNEDEEEIGKSIVELKLYELDTIEAFRGDNSYRAIIQGYVFETKLEDGSVPEERLGAIMATKNRTQQQEMFAELWANNEAENEEVGEYNVWVIYENDKTTRENKDFRLIMVFRGKATPYAVITNDHEVELPKVKEVWEDGEFKIQYLFKASASQKEKIEELIYKYLAL